MDAGDLREVFETILPQEALMTAVQASGLQERERKLDALALLRATVISAATGDGGRQADVMRLYFDNGCKRVVRGGFYAWFGTALEAAMSAVRERALAYAATQVRDLPGWLGRYVRDWIIVDSSTVKLDRRLMAEYPGAGDYAALKVHKHYSVGVGATLGYHLSPAREHDAPHLQIDASWSGLGLLADLGYASLRLLGDCERFDVKYVIRLKESWKPKVKTLIRGTLTRTFASGTDLDLLLDEGIIVLDDKAIDAQVRVGDTAHGVDCRLVAVRAPQGYCFYLTNPPKAVGPRQIVDLYRVRWEIESDNKLGKSCLRLDEIGARTGPAVRALVHASLIGSMIIGLLVHHQRRRERPPPRRGTERTSAPIHSQSLAHALGSAASSFANAMELRGDDARERWRQLADYLEHLGKDPNWRRRPSGLDQLRGWRITPGQPRKMRAASVVAAGAN